MKRLALAALMLLVVGCAPAALPSTSPASTPPSHSPSPPPSPTANCADGVLAPVRETGWQVCLPAGVSIEVEKTADRDFSVFSQIGSDQQIVGRLKVWTSSSGERPDAELWVLLHENPAEGKALYGRNEVEAPGTLSSAEFEQLNMLGIEILLNPDNYSLLS